MVGACPPCQEFRPGSPNHSVSLGTPNWWVLSGDLRCRDQLGREGAIVARRRLAPYRNVFEVLASIPQPVQARMQSRVGELVEGVAFTPQLVEIAIEAGDRAQGVQLRLVSTVLFSGGVEWSVMRTVERFGAQ